jgi:hypothetical protein
MTAAIKTRHTGALFRPSAEKLGAVAREHATAYQSATPFPHVTLDGLFPPEVLQAVLDEFPSPDDIEWWKFADHTGKKLATREESQIGDSTLSFLMQLNSSTFISFLEELTGITGLIPDPHLYGGGLHQIQRGGFLKVHADFNRHERLRLDRRLNLLVYLNRNWREEYGGHLELWSRDMKSVERKILPVFGRCVLFSTTDFSYHGHPDPVTCPEGVTRKSLALYYYTNGRPEEELSPTHGTLYQSRPGESVTSWRARLKGWISRLRK